MNTKAKNWTEDLSIFCLCDRLICSEFDDQPDESHTSFSISRKCARSTAYTYTFNSFSSVFLSRSMLPSRSRWSTHSTMIARAHTSVANATSALPSPSHWLFRRCGLNSQPVVLSSLRSFSCLIRLTKEKSVCKLLRTASGLFRQFVSVH